MKRRERKHLKEDEFVSTLTKLIRFLRQWQREVKIVGLSLLAILVLMAGIQVVRNRSIHRANKQLATILKLQSELESKDLSAKEEPSEIAELERIAGRGKFSRVAYIFLANYWVKKGDLNRAQTYLEKFPERPKDIFYYQAKDLLGQVLMWRQEFDRAIALFESLEKEKFSSYPREAILLHLAEALENKGDKAKALEKYRQVQDQFPNAAYFWNVADRIRRLGG